MIPDTGGVPLTETFHRGHFLHGIEGDVFGFENDVADMQAVFAEDTDLCGRQQRHGRREDQDVIDRRHTDHRDQEFPRTRFR